MGVRTDLAIELLNGQEQEGVRLENREKGGVKITETEIITEEAEKRLSKPRGKYVTLEFESVERLNSFDNIIEALKEEVTKLLPQDFQSILVVGLGNSEITADSIGPAVSARLLATRHIAGKFAESIGLKGLKSVSVVAPNVLGKTGIEAAEIIKGIVEKTKPQAVVVTDALASSSINRLFRTVQLCNTGISPGSGVKNSRKELSPEVLGVPVIAVGVPTVVDALTLAAEITDSQPVFDTDMVVTPKDADLLCHRISEIISHALNLALQPEIDPELLMSLV
ncbi:MAG: GPR endopeptidase [Clostridia bacterium]|nr:GPR endopeptidase [Clostridia bacterium]